MRKNQFLKVKISLLELEKGFIELEEIELKDREVKIKRGRLFLKPIIVSKDDMGKFEQNETKQIRSTEPIRKDVGGFKGKIEIVLKKTNRNCVWERKESKQTKDTKH